MLDFRIKILGQGAEGMNMGLCPGVYAGKESMQHAIFIAEVPFSFLESSIRRLSSRYARSYSHWGVTEIPRHEWFEIIVEWESLKTTVASVVTFEEISELFPMSEAVLDDFKNDFEENRRRLLSMIDQLLEWLRTTLSKHDSVSILGI
jgi:hypothetical protein